MAEESASPSFHLFAISRSGNPPFSVPIVINNKTISFQLDTGAASTVMTESDFKNVAPIDAKIRPCSSQLQTYTGQLIPTVGECDMEVSYCDQVARLPVVIVSGGGPPLLGRNWLSILKLDWKNIFSLSETVQSNLSNILENNISVFDTSSGLLNDRSVKISVKSDQIGNSKFFKPRVPPYALRDKIESELKRLEDNHIITKVDHSDWATPIVPVLKKDGSVRICGDYKVTVNKVVEQTRHPIPNVEDIAFKLAKGEKFTELDFSHAYTQLSLDENSKKLTTINTHKGLYQYERLCFGISSSPSIFQCVMDSIFQDIPNVCVYFDNVYITGPTDNEHLQTLDRVLRMVSAKGLRINKNKCQFLKTEIDFLGYRLSREGIKPQLEKTKAIKDAPTPKNVHELKSFLGLINYYSKFCGNLTDILSPLYMLLQKNTPWHWGKEQSKAFETARACLSSDTLLTHYDPKKELTLTCDASPKGVGAILSHGKQPIAYASRTLSSAERNYAQIDREGLSIIFGIKKFHKFIFGRKVTIVTDHKPLLGLFGEYKAIPEHASPRVQRWAIALAAYDYNLVHKPGIENSADCLSRLPLKINSLDFVPDDIEMLFSVIDNSIINVDDVKRETQIDECLVKIFDYCLNGWPNSTSELLKPYKNRQLELSIENGCILWGTRVIIPQSLQNNVLSILHDTHIGMSRMKSLARSWFWWPNMDADIEKFVKLCSTCAQHSKQPAKAPLQNWDWPIEPWKRIHIDFAGPFMNKMFLIVIDSHSKWLEVKVMKTITASDTIIELKEIFSTHGLPDQIVSDNGPSFTAQEFKMFCSANGIEHITSSPYHPATNGLAERAVGIFKSAMVKMSSKTSIRENVNRFLAKYRTTPHVTTGVSPAELLCGRKLKTHLDLCHPTVQKSVSQHQQTQKICHDKSAKDREIGVNENVFVRNYSRGNKWIPGEIVQSTGPVSYKVKTSDGSLLRRHADQIKVTCSDPEIESSKTVNPYIEPALVTQSNPDEVHAPNSTTNIHDNIVDMNLPNDASTNINESIRSDCCTNESIVNVPVRRSSRQVKAPDRLDL